MPYRNIPPNKNTYENMKNANIISLGGKTQNNNKAFSISNCHYSKPLNNLYQSSPLPSSPPPPSSSSGGNINYKAHRNAAGGGHASSNSSISNLQSSNNNTLNNTVINKQQSSTKDDKNVYNSTASIQSSSLTLKPFPFSSTNNNSVPTKRSILPLPPPVIKKPQGKNHVQMENEILKGLRIQQGWNDKPDIQFLCMSILNLCKLSPLDASDAHWMYAMSSVVQAIDHYKTKLTRHNVCMLARYRDSYELSVEKRKIEQEIKRTEDDIINAKNEYTRAKKRRKHREEYEKVSREICKKSSVHELNKAKLEEIERKNFVENLIKKTQQKIEYRQKQAFVVLQAANDFKKALTDPIPHIDF